MKIRVNKEVVKNILNLLKTKLNVSLLKEEFSQIRNDWKFNPLKIKGRNIHDVLLNVQGKIGKIDALFVTLMQAAEVVAEEVKSLNHLDPKSKLGAEKLQALAQLLDDIFPLPGLLEFFDKPVFYFLLQAIYYFRRDKIQGAK